MRSLTLSAALLSTSFLLGCQEQATSPVEPDDASPLFAKDKGCPESNHPSCGGDDSPTAGTFLVSVETKGGPVWATDQVMQDAEKQDWLHVFDSGGNGTRGKPNYENAAFVTAIHMVPKVSECETAPSVLPPGLETELMDKFDQAPKISRVFDFQVGYDIIDPDFAMGFSFFLFRWEEVDVNGVVRTFSASTGFGLDDSADAPTIVFLGDGEGGGGDIDDSSVTRVFEISGAMVIAKELNKNKVIATLSCPNDGTYVVTVAPNPPV